MSEGESGEERPAGSEGGFQPRRFPPSYFKAKPVKIGDELDVSISEVSRRGDGVVRIEGYIIFVPNTKQGDNVKIRITQIRPNHALGEVV